MMMRVEMRKTDPMDLRYEDLLSYGCHTKLYSINAIINMMTTHLSY